MSHDHTGSTRTTATTTRDAQDALSARMSQGACPTCDDLACLDCVADVAHERCTRPCPECTDTGVDWDVAWETTSIITELRGLERVDEAIRRL